MLCRICGNSENVEYRLAQKASLCPDCQESTPPKLGKAEFTRKYWGRDWDNVPRWIRKDFYQDYLLSFSTYEEYVESTVEPTPLPPAPHKVKEIFLSNLLADLGYEGGNLEGRQ